MALLGSKKDEKGALDPFREESVSRSGELSSLLGKGSEFDGKLAFEGQVRIDGKFSGQISTKDVLVIAEGARVNAEVTAGTVIIHGQFEGNVRAAQLIELKTPARVKGTLEAPALAMDKGVIFEGSCKMENLKGRGAVHRASQSKRASSGSREAHRGPPLPAHGTGVAALIWEQHSPSSPVRRPRHPRMREPRPAPSRGARACRSRCRRAGRRASGWRTASRPDLPEPRCCGSTAGRTKRTPSPPPPSCARSSRRSLGPGHLAKVREETAEGWSLLYFEVVASPPDGGAPRKSQPAVLGAKAVDDDFYLCASLPGAKPADVEAVAEACRELTVRAAP